MIAKTFLKNYAFSLVLLGSIAVGSVLGLLLKDKAAVLKPLGDLFLNALFAVVVPLIFFSIASAVAGMASTSRLLKILGWMMVVFFITAILSSLLMVVGVQFYPPVGPDVHMAMPAGAKVEPVHAASQIVGAITVPDFVDLLSKRNVLALIVFAILVGLGASSIGEKGRPFAAFLASGSEVFTKVISFIMYYAPIGLGAYFAHLVGTFGSQLLVSYGRAVTLYFPLTIAYFFIAFTIYAYLAGRREGVKRFWLNIPPAALTAAGTGSSFATIPLNLAAADRIGVPREISELVIPIGATIHMDGSCLAAILKIAFLFGVFNMPFTGFDTIATAIGVAILSGTVVSGIPGGGLTGEILILAMYGFPPEALPIMTMIGTLVDAPATLVNSIGDNVASMMLSRIVLGKKWLYAAQAPAAAEPEYSPVGD